MRDTIRNRQPADPAAVARTVDGRRPERLNAAEREAAVAELNRLGYSDGAIAKRVGITPRAVIRIRQRTGVPTAWRGGRQLRSVA